MMGEYSTVQTIDTILRACFISLFFCALPIGILARVNLGFTSPAYACFPIGMAVVWSCGILHRRNKDRKTQRIMIQPPTYDASANDAPAIVPEPDYDENCLDLGIFVFTLDVLATVFLAVTLSPMWQHLGLYMDYYILLGAFMTLNLCFANLCLIILLNFGLGCYKVIVDASWPPRWDRQSEPPKDVDMTRVPVVVPNSITGTGCC